MLSPHRCERCTLMTRLGRFTHRGNPRRAALILARRNVTDIFISYSSADRRVANALASCLTAVGWSVFVDHAAIPTGMTFDDYIERELEAAKCVLVLWSSTSVTSRWVRTEAHEGLKKNILLPVLIERDVNVPIAFRLVQARSMIDWDERAEAQAFIQLAADVVHLLGWPASEIAARGDGIDAARPSYKPSDMDLEDLDGPAWVDIPGGSFDMGAQDVDDAPVHKVTLSSYKISRFPITNAQYLIFVADAKPQSAEHWTRGEIPKGKERHPVTFVSWDDAAAFCAWLTGRLQPGSGGHVELPTEAQWEFAARGHEGRRYPWGDAEPTGQHANFNATVRGTTVVGATPDGATPRGVHDMAGNVWEWCGDWYGAYDLKPTKNPTGPISGTSRVLRGGAFSHNIAHPLRAAYRHHFNPDRECVDFGFRVAWSLAGRQK